MCYALRCVCVCVCVCVCRVEAKEEMSIGTDPMYSFPTDDRPPQFKTNKQLAMGQEELQACQTALCYTQLRKSELELCTPPGH